MVRKEDKANLSKTNLVVDSLCENDFKRPHMTSNDLKSLQKDDFVEANPNTDSAANPTTNKKKKLKSGSVHKTDEINHDFLDENLHDINF